MCIILDANAFSRFRNPNDEDMQPVRKWLANPNGKIVYSNTSKFKSEWEMGGMRRWRDEQMRAGKLISVSSEDVIGKENELKDEIISDDAHIIALALITQTKVLVSNDNNLIQDFKAQVSRGKVYTTKKQKHLLTKKTCP